VLPHTQWQLIRHDSVVWPRQGSVVGFAVQVLVKKERQAPIR
jgi:hypothetical protein